MLSDGVRPASIARFIDWERAADDIAAMLRSAAGRNPHDRLLIELIGELFTRNAEFRARWAARNVRFHRSGHKKLHHPDGIPRSARAGADRLRGTAGHPPPPTDWNRRATWATTVEQTGEFSARTLE